MNCLDFAIALVGVSVPTGTKTIVQVAICTLKLHKSDLLPAERAVARLLRNFDRKIHYSLEFR